MLNFMRNILWWRKSEREEEEEEGLEQGFHDLPHPKERAKMSPEKLAILLSGQKEKSPAYILVEWHQNGTRTKEAGKCRTSRLQGSDG